ncbi:MAG: hypothetical protein Q7S87_09080 [Agitococcus sp.]|nr:hypothetical protein [Agitococcus sp.]MDO9177054.1 hypothetical protein [Agitococcus sp.]
MNMFSTRQIPLGELDSFSVLVHIRAELAHTQVVLQEDKTSLVSTGQLSANFEHVANVLKIEMQMRQLPANVLFYHYRPQIVRGVVVQLAQVCKVNMKSKGGSYYDAQWELCPLSDEVLPLLIRQPD